MLVPLNQACIILSLNGYDYGEVGGVGCDYDDGDGDDDIGDYDDDADDDDHDHDHADDGVPSF